MAKITVYIYRCTNAGCRYVERWSGVRKSQVKCPKCGGNMRFISQEKVG